MSTITTLYCSARGGTWSIALLMTTMLANRSSLAAAPTKSDFKKIPQKYSAGSPSGGPAKNGDAAVLIFYRKSKTLHWMTGNTIHSCPIVQPRETSDTVKGGSTPVGEFLIGRHFHHPAKDRDWYKLYPRKPDNSGYFDYHDTKSPRNEMGLHSGVSSIGCVTVKATKEEGDGNPCWRTLRGYLDARKTTYRGSHYCGFLYVEDF